MRTLSFDRVAEPLSSWLKVIDLSIPRQLDGRQEIVWFFFQIDRIGHLSKEPLIIRNLFPPSRYALTAVVPSTSARPWAVNDVASFLKDFRTFEINDPKAFPPVELMCSNTAIEVSGRLFVFSISTPLMNEFIAYIKHGNPINYENPLPAQQNRVDEFIDRNKLGNFKKYAIFHAREGNCLGHLMAYQNFRDANPRNAELAISTLIDHGYAVIRIGDKSMTPLNLRVRGLVDLPFTGEMGDIPHIDLVSCCQLYFGTTSGPECTANLYNIPRIYHNATGITHLVGDNVVLLHKSCFDIKLKRLLTLEEMHHRQITNYGTMAEFNNDQLLLIENSPLQIDALVREGLALFASSGNLPERAAYAQTLSALACIVETQPGVLFGPASSQSFYFSSAFI